MSGRIQRGRSADGRGAWGASPRRAAPWLAALAALLAALTPGGILQAAEAMAGEAQADEALAGDVGSGGGLADEAPERPAVMAVLPLNFTRGPAIYTWLRSAIPAALADKALLMPGARVADPADVAAALAAEGGTGPAGLPVDRELARAVAQRVGADTALWGDVSKVGEAVLIDLYVSPVGSDVDWVRLAHQGPAEELVPLIGEIATQLAAQLGVDTEGEVGPLLAAPAARDRYTLVLWGRALNQLFGVGQEADPAAARPTLEKALRIDPRLASGWYSLALVALAEGDPSAAASALYEVLRHRPWDARARRRLAEWATRAGRLPEAREHLAELVALEPEDAAAHLSLARTLTQLDRHREALVEAELASRAPRTTPQIRADALRLSARLRGVAGDLVGMEQAFKALLERSPGDREALIALGSAAFATGRPGEAAAYVDALRRQDITAPLPPHILGEIALSRGEAEAAVAAFNAEIATLHASAEAFRYLARAWEAAGDPASALQTLERATSFVGEDPSLWRALAAARRRAGDPRGAAQALQRALELAPGWPDLHVDQGVLALSVGDLPLAQAALERALGLDDSLATAHYHLALTFHAAGRSGAAAEHLRLAVALDPGMTAALYNLAVVLDERGDAQAAASAFEDYLRASPSDPLAAAITSRVEALRAGGSGPVSTPAAGPTRRR